MGEHFTLRGLLWLLLLTGLITGCNPQPYIAPAPPAIIEPDIPLGFTPKFNRYDSLQTKVWNAYGKALHTCSNQYPALSFEREVCARASAIHTYENEFQGYQYRHKPLLELAKTHRVGFLREYTWHFLRKPYWVKPDGLALGKFETWLQMGLPGHEPNEEPGVFLMNDPQVPSHTSTLANRAEESKQNPGFPDLINRFKFAGYTQYSSDILGEKARYKGRNDTLMEAYIYPLPTQYQERISSDFLRSLYSTEKAAVLKLEEKQTYEEVKVIFEGAMPNNITPFPSRLGTYFFRNRLDRNYRMIYLSIYQDQLIKVVFHQPTGAHYDMPRDFNNDALAFLAWAKHKIDYQADLAKEGQPNLPQDLNAALDNNN